MAGKSVTVIGGDLFRLALQHLGDATQWNRIAELNGTGPDPVLPRGVVTTLALPSQDKTAGGGVYTAVAIVTR